MGFVLDMTNFEKGFNEITRGVIPSAAATGLFMAGNELIRDAIYKRPMAPFDEGHLRAAGRTNQPEISQNKISVSSGFFIEYAARWHELTPEEDSRIKWTLPGSGAKYLESKMMMFKDKYIQITAENIKNKGK